MTNDEKLRQYNLVSKSSATTPSNYFNSCQPEVNTANRNTSINNIPYLKHVI